MQAAGQAAGRRAPWIAARAALAVALVAGFYLLALGMAGGLLFVPVAEWRFLRRVDLRKSGFARWS